MPSNTLSAAVSRAPWLGAPGPAPASARSGEGARVAPPGAVAGGTGGGPARGLRPVLSALLGFAGIVAVAWAFPLAILAIGIPIALLVRLVMWVAGAL
jgi:hypothetical protein